MSAHSLSTGNDSKSTQEPNSPPAVSVPEREGLIQRLRAGPRVLGAALTMMNAADRITELEAALRELLETEDLLRRNDERADEDDMISAALAELLIRHGAAWESARRLLGDTNDG